jgi:hypothetical protein
MLMKIKAVIENRKFRNHLRSGRIGSTFCRMERAGGTQYGVALKRAQTALQKGKQEGLLLPLGGAVLGDDG